MKTEKQIRAQLADSRRGLKMFEQADSETPDQYIHQGWVEALEFVLKSSKPKLTDQQKLKKLGITKEIMGAMNDIGRLYLHRNFWKGTNGIFWDVKPLKRVSFDKYDDVDDPDSGYHKADGWKLRVKFGVQDDTANETYTAIVYVAKADIDDYLKNQNKYPCPEFQEEGVGNCCFDVD